MQCGVHRVQLFCFPHAGSSALAYGRWQSRLAPRIDVRPVEPPGRGRRWGEPLCEDIAAIVADLTGVVQRQIDGPYALFGHSLGALVAFEVAHALHLRTARAPTALFVSGCRAPAMHEKERYAAERSDAELITELAELGGTSQEILESAEWMAMTLPVLRADYRICTSYRYARRRPFEFPLHVFSGRQDDMTRDRLDPWRSETTGPFTLDWFDGGHFFLQQAEAGLLGLIEHYAGRALDRPRAGVRRSRGGGA